MSLVSVVMPVSGPEFFQESLESICNQIYQNLEIIIVDSSEKKQVQDIVYSMNDKRIRYFYQKKSGVANALNFGIAKASGEYIARMDSDDVAFLNRIAKQSEFLDVHPEIALVAASCMIINEKGECIREEIRQCSADEIKYRLLFDNPICHPTVMFRKSVFEQGWKYENVFAEDYDLWVRLATSYKMEVLPDVLLKYRVHENNLSNTNVLRLSNSDTDSALKYLNTLFPIGLAFDRKFLLIKNYHLLRATVEDVGDVGDFLISQYDLLDAICKKAESFGEKEKDIINKIILYRWKKCLEISPVLYSDEKLEGFPPDDSDRKSFRKYLLSVIQNNNCHIKKMQKDGMRFLLYGYGERGHRTLERYLKLCCQGKNANNWELLGIIDREKKSYWVNGNKCNTCMKEEIGKYDFDYIVISAIDFYKEIRKELIGLGVPDKKIIKDGLFFLYKSE